jgi:hypothetical protein
MAATTDAMPDTIGPLPASAPAGKGDLPGWAWLLLVAVAAVETMGGLSSLFVLFGGDPDIPGPGPGGLAVKTYLALRPLLAPAALVCLASGRPRLAIGLLAGVVALYWLNMLPSFLLHGLEFRGVATVTTTAFLLYPALAAAGALLAWRNRRLALAALCVSSQTLFDVFGVLTFAIGVTLYGF